MTGVGSQKLAEQCLRSERRTVRRVWVGGRWGGKARCALRRKGLRTFSSGCFSVNGSEAIKWVWGKERSVQGLKGETAEWEDEPMRPVSEATALPVLSSPAHLPSLASAPSLERGRGERWDTPPFNNCKTPSQGFPTEEIQKTEMSPPQTH